MSQKIGKYPISIRIAVHVHATESEEKVRRAVKNILPKEVRINFSREMHTGFYGNPIIRLEAVIRERSLAKKIFEHIFRNIKGFAYPGWVEERFDVQQKSLYLRLDKQEAYLGNIKLGWGDDIIHVIFKFPGYLNIGAKDIEIMIEKMREKSAEL